MPYIFLLSVFGYFVLWNGGVVLGKRGIYTSLTPEADIDQATKRTTFPPFI